MRTFPHSGLLALAFVPAGLLAQEPVQEYVVDDPTNWDCENALRLCADTRFSFLNGDHPDGCLYFYFIVGTDQAVNVHAIGGVGDRVQVVDDGQSEASMCAVPPEPLCPPLNAQSSVTFDETASNVVFIMWDPASNDTGTLFVDFKTGIPPCEPLGCCDCLPSFQPHAGRTYVLSAWCKLEGAPASRSSYAGTDGPYINVATNVGTILSVPPEGPIIDGWQRMERQFTLQGLADDMTISLHCDGCTALFDDVRFFPELSSMKCTVYDPVTLRLDAELDERHYATFYEYDGEGKLVRIKKETERGIMTIQETRYNSSKLFQTP